MATISTLAVKILLNTADFAANANTVIATTNKMAAAFNPLDSALNATASAVTKVTGAYNEATTAATSHLKTVLGIGSASAVVAKGLLAYSAAQSAAQRAGQSAPIQTLADAWTRLTDAVDAAFVAFGKGVSDTGAVARTMQLLTNTLTTLTPAFAATGTVVGFLWDWLANYPPVMLAIVATAKALAVVFGVLLQRAIANWIVGQITMLLLGSKMTLLQAIMSAKAIFLVAANTAWAASIWLVNGAMAVLAAIGLPLWALIAVAIAAVVGVTYLLVKAWNALTGATVSLPGISNLQAMGTAAEDAGKKIDDLHAKLNRDLKTAGMSEQAIQRMDYADSLNAPGRTVADRANVDQLNRSLQLAYDSGMRFEDALRAVMKADYAAHLQNIESQKALRERAKTLDDVAKQARQSGMSDTAKKLDDFAAAGAGPAELAAMERLLNMLTKRETIRERERQIASIISAIETEAAQHGMTDMEKRIALAEQLGATEEQIRKIREAAAQIEASQQQEKALAEFEQLMAEMERQGKTLAQSVMTPFEQLQSKLQDIERLRTVGAISDTVARRAADAADAEFRQSLGRSSFEASSPQALLKGSAEASLAANRATNPIDNLTKVQREELAEVKRLRTDLNDKLGAISANTGDSAVVNF